MVKEQVIVRFLGVAERASELPAALVSVTPAHYKFNQPAYQIGAGPSSSGLE
jgi:hypothetical protein